MMIIDELRKLEKKESDLDKLAVITAAVDYMEQLEADNEELRKRADRAERRRVALIEDIKKLSEVCL